MSSSGSLEPNWGGMKMIVSSGMAWPGWGSMIDRRRASAEPRAGATGIETPPEIPETALDGIP